MQIKSTITNSNGQNAAHAYCFYNDKLVVVYNKIKDHWTPPGGGVEVGESLVDAMHREIKEEVNMKVLHMQIIGYQDIFEPAKTSSQARFLCIVEPFGPFKNDPDGDITKVELIEPQDYKKYFDWGKIGDHLIERALEIKSGLKNR